MSQPQTSPYEHAFNNIQKYVLHGQLVKVTSSSELHDAYKKYNAICDKLQKQKNIKEPFLKIISSTHWTPECQTVIKSIFGSKAELVICRLQQLFQFQITVGQIIKVMKGNTSNFQKCQFTPNKVTQNIKEMLQKIKLYQQFISLSGEYPNQSNMEKMESIANKEYFVKNKKAFQNLRLQKNTIKLIDEQVQQFAYNRATKKNGQFQVLLTERITEPILQLIENYKHAQSCIRLMKEFKVQELKKSIDKKYGVQNMNQINQIVNEQSKILSTINSIKQQLQRSFALSNYPYEQPKQQTSVKDSLEEICRKAKTVNQIICIYDSFAKKITLSQIISKKIQKYSSQSLTGNKHAWKAKIESYTKIVLEQFSNLSKENEKKGFNNVQKSQKNQMQSEQVGALNSLKIQINRLNNQISALSRIISENQSKITEANKGKAELKRDLVSITDKIAQMSKILNLDPSYPIDEKDISIASLEAIVTKFLTVPKQQTFDQLNFNFQKVKSHNAQLLDQKSTLNLAINRVRQEKQKYYKKYQQQQSQRKRIEYLNDKLASQNLELKDQLQQLQQISQERQQSQVDYTAKINPFQQQSLIEQSQQKINDFFIKNSDRLHQIIEGKTQAYIKRLRNIEQTLSDFSIMMEAKRNHSLELKQELDKTVIQLNWEKENSKVRELTNQLNQKKQLVNRLNRELTQKNKQLRNLAFDLEMEKETVKSLNLELQLKEYSENSNNQGVNSKEYQEKICQMQKQLQESDIKVKANQHSILELKKQLISMDSQKRNAKDYKDDISEMKQQLEESGMIFKTNEKDILDLKKQLASMESQKRSASEELNIQKKANLQLQERVKTLQKGKKEPSQIIFQPSQTQFRAHKQALRELYLRKYGVQGSQEPSSVCLAYIDKFFQGRLLQQSIEYKYRILRHLQKVTPKKVLKTTLLYQMDALNPTNFHKYIDGHKNVLSLVKTKIGMFLAGFYLGTYAQQIMTDPGLLIAVSRNESYALKDPINSKKFRAMVYDPYYIIYGNAQLRIRGGENTFFSNFGINNSYYNSRDKRLIQFTGEGNHDIDIVSYEVYSLQLEEAQEEQRERNQ